MKCHPQKYINDDISKIKTELDHGFCQGWSLLLAATPKENWKTFYSEIKELIDWNGNEEQLTSNKPLQNLFEQMLNDLRWLSNLHGLINTTYRDAHQLIHFISPTCDFKELIFNLDSFFFLEPTEVEMILKLIAEPGKKIGVVSAGVQGPGSHSILLVKQQDDEYIILDDKSGAGPLLFASLEDVVSALYGIFETEENTNIGLHFCVYENSDSADKKRYTEHKQHLLHFFSKKKTKDKLDKSTGEEIPSNYSLSS